jgi:hypothetical protein
MSIKLNMQDFDRKKKEKQKTILQLQTSGA